MMMVGDIYLFYDTLSLPKLTHKSVKFLFACD